MDPQSSRLLQIVNTFDRIHAFFYLIVSIVIFVFKGFAIKYGPDALWPDLFALFFLFLIKLLHLNSANIGNLTESSSFLLASVIDSAFVICAYLYFMFLQTYVLFIEVLLNVSGLIFVCLQLLLTIFTFLAVSKLEKEI